MQHFTLGLKRMVAMTTVPLMLTLLIQPASAGRIDSAGFNACKAYWSNNGGANRLGYLINAYYNGRGAYTCDFSKACVTVTAWGRQASLPVRSLMKRQDTVA